jgi:hypothetical protein
VIRWLLSIKTCLDVFLLGCSGDAQVTFGVTHVFDGGDERDETEE